MNRPTVAEVVAKLQTYGSADQIAQFFEREGVCGQPGQAYHCPVARYVTHEIAQPVSVCSVLITGAEDADLDPYSPLSEFIQRFDLGQYPVLEVHLP